MVEIDKQISHKEPIHEAINTESMVDVTIECKDKVNEKLCNLHLSDASFPGGCSVWP